MDAGLEGVLLHLELDVALLGLLGLLLPGLQPQGVAADDFCRRPGPPWPVPAPAAFPPRRAGRLLRRSSPAASSCRTASSRSSTSWAAAARRRAGPWPRRRRRSPPPPSGAGLQLWACQGPGALARSVPPGRLASRPPGAAPFRPISSRRAGARRSGRRWSPPGPPGPPAPAGSGRCSPGCSGCWSSARRWPFSSSLASACRCIISKRTPSASTSFSRIWAEYPSAAA